MTDVSLVSCFHSVSLSHGFVLLIFDLKAKIIEQKE
jgi:hypothetical protein